MESAYIHIPFCKKICPYCDFCKMLYNKDLTLKYLDSLDKEIKLNYRGETLNTIYIGGGSPSALNTFELKKLFLVIDNLKRSETQEVTFEVNVLDINEKMLKLLKVNGVNRLSIGIESINPLIQEIIDRKYDKKLVNEKILLAKKYFNNINIDLMYGFDCENMDMLKKDLDFVTSLKPSHISIYSLQIEEHTLFYIKNVKRVDDDLDFEMYKYICSYLKKKGYIHYEISNFALEEYASRHNLTYWNNKEYYGFGLGASGYTGSFRYTNTKSINKYLKGEYKSFEEHIDKKKDMEYEMILGLRKISGVKKDDFYNKFNCNIDDVFDIIDLVKKGLLLEKDGYLYISENNLYVSNSILLNFLGGSV